MKTDRFGGLSFVIRGNPWPFRPPTLSFRRRPESRGAARGLWRSDLFLAWGAARSRTLLAPRPPCQYPVGANHAARYIIRPGEMLEWPIRRAWKARISARGSWVRIPLSPPFQAGCLPGVERLETVVSDPVLFESG